MKVRLYGMYSGACVVLLVGVCCVKPLAAQERRIIPEAAKRMVVSINTYDHATERQVRVGAGVIVGMDERQLYIVTAGHLFKDGDDVSVRVSFADAADTRVPATLRSDTAHDIRIITVSRADLPRGFVEPELANRLGDPKSVSHGSAVWPVGCPNGACWTVPGTPDRVMVRSDEYVFFQSLFVDGGSSGGGLFNEWWELIGMVANESPPRVDAVSINLVMEYLKKWGIPMDLDKPSVPRGGYRTTVGISALLPEGSHFTPPDNRTPSGRITISRRPSRTVSWHIAFTRLAETDLAVNAGTIGGALHLGNGRFAVRPFAEAGFARVEGRHDIGGYYMNTNNQDTYVPVYQREQEDALGAGLGASVEITMVGRLIMELVGSTWTFPTPDNVPGLSRFFVGTGLRWGI